MIETAQDKMERQIARQQGKARDMYYKNKLYVEVNIDHMPLEKLCFFAKEQDRLYLYFTGNYHITQGNT